MLRYFAAEPRYSRQELEQQAQEAIDARVALGRPPEEDFLPLQKRLAEIDAALAARPVDPQPLQVREVLRPPAAPAPAAPPSGRGRPLVAARHSVN